MKLQNINLCWQDDLVAEAGEMGLYRPVLGRVGVVGWNIA